MSKSRYYILDVAHNLVPVDSVHQWAAFFEDDTKRRVASDKFRKSRAGHPNEEIIVSTVFLGLDHSFDASAPPLVFETMIFGGKHAEYQERYETWDEAVVGHARALKLARGRKVRGG